MTVYKNTIWRHFMIVLLRRRRREMLNVWLTLCMWIFFSWQFIIIFPHFDLDDIFSYKWILCEIYVLLTGLLHKGNVKLKYDGNKKEEMVQRITSSSYLYMYNNIIIIRLKSRKWDCEIVKDIIIHFNNNAS